MSAETNALIAYLRHTGVPHRVTSITGGTHSDGSRHYLGLAVDFAGPRPGRGTHELRAIFGAFTPIEGQLYELIYSGASYSIKNGQRVPRYAVDTHWNHVHVSVDRGFSWAPPEVRPMYSPPLNIAIVAHLKAPSGGVWVLGQDGGVFSFDSPFYGSAAGKDYFVGRKAARLEARPDGGYDIIATSGERYGYPAS